MTTFGKLGTNLGVVFSDGSSLLLPMTEWLDQQFVLRILTRMHGDGFNALSEDDWIDFVFTAYDLAEEV